MADLNAFETPLVKVPFEALRRTSRDRKYAVDALASAAASLDEAAERAARGAPATTADAAALVDSLADRLSALKRKLEEASPDEAASASRVAARLRHLAACGPRPPPGGAVRWASPRLDRLLAEDLLRRGRLKAGAALVEEAGLQDLVDWQVFDGAAAALAGLAARDAAPALAWCAAHAPRLARAKSSLAFRLRLQQFVELARVGKGMDALTHARTHLAPAAAADGARLAELQAVAGLLAFGPERAAGRYKALLDDSRWAECGDALRADLFRLHAMPARSPMGVRLQAGLTALKPPPGAGEAGARDDPLACAPLAELAAPLPHARPLHSRLVCGLTGAILDADNPPAALPSGAVYGEAALRARAGADGVLACPDTGEAVPVASLRRVFIS